MRNLFIFSLLVLSGAQALATNCQISVPSDMNSPNVFDKILWSGYGDLGTVQYFVLDRAHKLISQPSELQVNDQFFLKDHDGQTVLAIGKPFPGDSAPGDQQISVATISKIKGTYRKPWVTSAGNLSDQTSNLGLTVSDLQRGVSVFCK